MSRPTYRIFSSKELHSKPICETYYSQSKQVSSSVINRIWQSWPKQYWVHNPAEHERLCSLNILKCLSTSNQES